MGFGTNKQLLYLGVLCTVSISLYMANRSKLAIGRELDFTSNDGSDLEWQPGSGSKSQIEMQTQYSPEKIEPEQLQKSIEAPKETLPVTGTNTTSTTSTSTPTTTTKKPINQSYPNVNTITLQSIQKNQSETKPSTLQEEELRESVSHLRAAKEQALLVANAARAQATDEHVKYHPYRNRMRSIVQKEFQQYMATDINGKLVDITQNRPRIANYDKPPEEPAWQKPPETPDEELNIMLFYADDWTLRVLGALNKYVKTPNIDALAKDGMLFPYNCVTTSICWISRATMVTGTYAAVHDHRMPGSMGMFENKNFDWGNTLFPLLKADGYYTGHVGKWHAPDPENEMDLAYDFRKPYFGFHWLEWGGRMRHITDINEEDALEFMRTRPTDQKFALAVNFFATHADDEDFSEPYKPIANTTIYENVTIPEVRTNTDAHFNALPPFLTQEFNEGRYRWENRYDTPENFQKSTRKLYQMATEVDTVVGKIVDELKAQGVYEKTFIVFTTDNGNLQGEHGLAEKWYPYEESIRVPLVIRDPRMPKSQRGGVSNEFTLSVDLAPTILSAAKVKVPDFMQGRDIGEIYFDPKHATKTWRKDFFYEWNVGDPVNATGHVDDMHIAAVFALVRKDWKYFYWPQYDYEQLFKIETDVDEEFDVRNSNATTTVKALEFMRARYRFMKDYAQAGNPV